MRFLLSLALTLALSTLALCPSSWGQESDTGSVTLRLVSGTTGEPGSAGQVQLFLLEEQEGMTPIFSTENVEGTVELPGLQAGQDYVAMADKDGVTYSSRFTYAPGDAIQLTVYDTTSENPGIQPSLTHLVVFVHGGQLHIRRQYRVTNPSQLTYVNSAGTFDFLVSPEAQQVRAAVTTNELPLTVLPEALEARGHFQINRPLPPGDTRVEVDYTIPYPGNEKIIEEPFKADISKSWVGVIPPEVAVFSTQLVEQGVDDQLNARLFLPREDFPGNAFTIALTGAGIEMSEGQAGGGGGGGTGEIEVVTLAPHGTNTILMYSLGFAGVLLVLFVMTLRRRPGAVVAEGTDADIEHMSVEELQAEKSRLLARIAELDRLQRGDKTSSRRSPMSRDPDSRERQELKARAKAVMRRLVEHGHLPESSRAR